MIMVTEQGKNPEILLEKMFFLSLAELNSSLKKFLNFKKLFLSKQ